MPFAIAYGMNATATNHGTEGKTMGDTLKEAAMELRRVLMDEYERACHYLWAARMDRRDYLRAYRATIDAEIEAVRIAAGM